MKQSTVDLPAGVDAQLAKVESRRARPKIVRDIVFVPTEEGTLLDGLPHAEMIRGPVAQTVLSDLITWMDGTHTLEQIEAAFPSLPSEYVHTAVSLLSDWGLLADESEPGGVSPDTVAFLRRHLVGAGFGDCVGEASIRLENADVMVVMARGDEEQARWVQFVLEGTGARRVHRTTLDKFRVALPLERPAFVVAVSTDGEDLAAFEELDEIKRLFGISWLRSVIERKRQMADVGPLFEAGASASCYRCFRETQAFPLPDTTYPLETLEAHCWASLLAVELTYILAAPKLAMTRARAFRRFRLSRLDSRILRYPRLPGCPHCRPHVLSPPSKSNDSNEEMVTDVSLVFEESVGLESRDELTPRAREEFAHLAFAGSLESKRFVNSEQIPLPRGSLELQTDTLAAMRKSKSKFHLKFTLDKLSIILALSAGVREIAGNQVRRWAASAGNLGSVELFVAALQVEGLRPGVYFYQPAEHTLAALDYHEALGTDEFIARAIACDVGDLPDALIVFTGAFDRLSRKYGPFGYRLINLDAGSVLSQLHLVTRSLGLWSRTITQCADDLISQQLHLRNGDEQTTAAVEIRRGRRNQTGILPFLARPLKNSFRRPQFPAAAKAANASVAYTPQLEAAPLEKWMESRAFQQPVRRSPSRPENFNAGTLRSWKASRYFFDLTLQEISQTLFEESRMRESDLSRRPHQVPNEVLDGIRRQPLSIQFAKPERNGLPLGDVLSKRRSIRRYGGSAVSVQQLGTALHCAHSADADEWPQEHQCGLVLQYTVVAANVTGVEAGVYEYDAGRQGLVQVGARLSREQMVALLVQSEYAQAPVLIWISGNLAAACLRYGASGHRQLLLRAGAAGTACGWPL